MLSEEEKKAIERLEEQLNFWKKQNIKNSDCEIILNLINRLKKENEEKDKQIDLMAKWIFDKDYIKNSLLIHRDDCYSNCIKQVKKYFEKLAKETE